MNINFFYVLLCSLCVNFLVAQNPVKWETTAEALNGSEYQLVFTATIDDGWNIYSIHMKEGGPIPTSFTFTPELHYKLEGKTEESGDKKEGHDDIFDMQVIKLLHKAVYKQKIKVSDASKPIKGYFTYMTCNDKTCLPPKDIDFSIALPKSANTPNNNNITTNNNINNNTTTATSSANNVPTPVSPTTSTATTTATPAKLEPTKWHFSTQKIGEKEFDLIFKANIENGWHVYSQFVKDDAGPIPVTITYAEPNNLELVGKAKEEGGRHEGFDKVFGVHLVYFEKEMTITQRVKVKDTTQPIKGYLNFGVCDETKCLPPKDVDFSLNLSGENVATAVATAEEGTFDSKREIDATKFVQDCGEAKTTSDSLFLTFIFGFLGGLLALLTPCVFPMIPLTVSFFTKRSPDRATGIRNALIYAFSIIAIYVTIGIVLTSIFGPTVLNEMSTDMYFNLLFFVVFILFAGSFFGFYEIQLPSSWVNKTDSAADKGGILGILFMAFTLALVSFSCTGPIIGTLLVQTVQNVNDFLFGFIPLKPLSGMLGFSIALALPFGLFAMFPSWLNSLPKSGSWMNNVKVTLGFIELALAFKFLSTADMVRHWNFLKLEIFLGLWVLIFLGLALYQFGVIRFPHDHPVKRMNIGRWTVGLSSLFFVFYLCTGFTYKPLALLSGLAPPVHYSFWGPKGCPHGLECFHDFDEGVAYAKKVNKPILVDFTGYGCVNCRKMEENVWNKAEVLESLKKDYILISLYVDDQQRLFPEDRQKFLVDKHNNEKLRTVGSKWASFQVNNFGTSSQPYYVLMHHDGKTLLNQPVAYTPEVSQYAHFLKCGLEGFKKINK